MEVKSFQLSAIITNSPILDVERGPGLVTLIFVSQKTTTSNSIQKLFMTETVSTVIVKSYLLKQDPASYYHLKLTFLTQ